MSKILEPAHAGTLESSDVFVRVVPSEHAGIEVELESSVSEIYGEAIESLIKATAEAMEANYVRILVQDKGALDYVIKARVQTAILRARGTTNPDWSLLS
ncbi:MAG: citrate lyase acyl carrier protein [Sulfurospirillaceae bacterium]|jgi:citrate lyase subunit gamma (acyl carrier protein)|nr:citrate lyase acyl carrier protein [Sulfurospirillaceae bacterium]MDD2827908.1 citrate lyase acyl carrier protein [Sulfurospirillaceae bacterium]